MRFGDVVVSPTTNQLLPDDNIDFSERTDGSTTLSFGFSGNDLIKGGSQTDWIYGGVGGDTLYGNEGSDYIYGGADNDVLIGGAGNDQIWGGDNGQEFGSANEVDTADYSTSPSPISIKYDGASSSRSINVDDGYGGTDTLHSIEKIVGTTGRDSVKIIGDISSNENLTIDANGGQGASPSDTINLHYAYSGVSLYNRSGSNNDIEGSIVDQNTGGTIYLKNFHTGIVGSTFDDVIDDESSEEKNIYGGDGNDTISVGESAGDATINGGSGSDSITGGSGNDILIGGDGNNNLSGGAGDDLIISTSNDVVDGGSGNDYIRSNWGGTITGGTGNDLIDAVTGSSGDWSTVIFNEGDGNDTLISETVDDPDLGISTRWGVSEFDMSSVSRSDVTFLWDPEVIGGTGSIGSPPDIPGNVNLKGELAIRLDDGSSIYLGMAYGSQPTWSSTVPDNYDPSQPVSLRIPGIEFSDGYFNGELDDGSFQYNLSIENPELLNVAQSSYEGHGAPGDTAQTGTSGNDVLSNDNKSGSINAGGGDDTVNVTSGDLRVDGGDGVDTVNMFNSIGSYTRSYDGTSLVLTGNDAGSGSISLKNVEYIYSVSDGVNYAVSDLISQFGTPGDDIINGTEFADTITGGDGDDVINPNGGFDNIDGGDGSDTINFSGSSSDYNISRNTDGTINISDPNSYFDGVTASNVETFYFAGDGATISVSSLPPLGTSGNDVIIGTARSDSLYGGDGDDVIQGFGGNDYLEGGNGNDVLDGGDGDDVLIGDFLWNQTGDDDLTGGAGNDVLDGGAGNNTAHYAGAMASYSMMTVDGSLEVVDNEPAVDRDDGTDTLYDIQNIQFSDAVRSLASPIVLDLDGNGIQLEQKASGVRFDWDGDGKADATGWVAPGDGLLVIDRDNNGLVSDASELSFTSDKEGAKSDLDGLSSFDSDHDGLISDLDADFNEFKVWVDANQDGISSVDEVKSLGDVGIKAISLAGSAVNQSWNWDDNVVFNTGTFVRVDGSSGSFDDVALNYDRTTAEAPVAGASVSNANAARLAEALAGQPSSRKHLGEFDGATAQGMYERSLASGFEGHHRAYA